MIHVSINTLLPYLVVAAGVIAAWRFRAYGGGGTAIASLEAANRVLEKRVRDLEHESETRGRRIAELEGRTDIALAIMPVLEALKTHEVEAARRSHAMLAVLDQIAVKLGPDHD